MLRPSVQYWLSYIHLFSTSCVTSICSVLAVLRPSVHTGLFQFEGAEIDLDSRVGIFITMNPGYAGRTELPESVKALFRPVVVIVPDLQQICEIMLFSEGFLLAKVRLTNGLSIVFKLKADPLSVALS